MSNKTIKDLINTLNMNTNNILSKLRDEVKRTTIEMYDERVYDKLYSAKKAILLDISNSLSTNLETREIRDILLDYNYTSSVDKPVMVRLQDIAITFDVLEEIHPTLTDN